MKLDINNMIRSYKKSKKLRKLQLALHPPNISTIDKLTEDILHSNLKYSEQKLEEFYDLCENDINVKDVMKKYGLTREDLKEIHFLLSYFGLAQWINDHYASLSSIAYPETLFYIAEARQRDYDPQKIVLILIEYWKGNIPNGGLLKLLNQ